MDLKIKDVADLLNVSETTIRRWVVDGKMPAYRLNHQYRFSRTEIESWVMSRKLGKEDDQAPFGEEVAFEDLTVQDRSSKGGTKQFSLYRAIHKGGIYHQVQGTTKEEVIRNTMLQVATRLDLDADVLT
ncbi:MAG: PTS system nitrogen regulatory IIA component, partial [Chlamydiales bacterium]